MHTKRDSFFIGFISLLIMVLLLIFFGIFSYFFSVEDYTLIAGIIGFFGAIIGGTLTLVGVRITLNKQEETRQIEKEHQRYLFFAHLNKMYFRVDTLLKSNSEINKDSWVFADSITMVPNWEERLLFLDNLDRDEILSIFNWLSDYGEEIKISPSLGEHKESKEPELSDFDRNIKTINTLAVQNIFYRHRDKISSILTKYYENNS